MLALYPPSCVQASTKAHMSTLMHACTVKKSHFGIISEKHLYILCDDLIGTSLVFDLLKYARKKPLLIYI